MGRSTKEKQEQNRTITWAARYHEEYVMFGGILFSCLAVMRNGKAVLRLYDYDGNRAYFEDYLKANKN